METEVRYRVNKSPSLDPTLNHVNLAYIVKAYFFKMHFNIISHLNGTKWNEIKYWIENNYSEN
jgi:hypothetical protein